VRCRGTASRLAHSLLPRAVRARASYRRKLPRIARGRYAGEGIMACRGNAYARARGARRPRTVEAYRKGWGATGRLRASRSSVGGGHHL